MRYINLPFPNSKLIIVTVRAVACAVAIANAQYSVSFRGDIDINSKVHAQELEVVSERSRVRVSF
jgi:hypothetical protein